MKRTKQFFLIIFSLILAFSCGKEPENNTSVNNIVASNIVVPSKIEVQEGDNISFRLIATTGATTSDYIVLRSASQNDYVCKIVSVGSNALVFELPSDLVIATIVRDGKPLKVKGRTLLCAGDILLITSD